jgi:hypothetical protein
VKIVQNGFGFVLHFPPPARPNPSQATGLPQEREDRWVRFVFCPHALQSSTLLPFVLSSSLRVLCGSAAHPRAPPLPIGVELRSLARKSWPRGASPAILHQEPRFISAALRVCCNSSCAFLRWNGRVVKTRSS